MEYMYSIKRKVIKGSKIARTFGYPTANLKYYRRDERLSNGVYIVNIQSGNDKFRGLAFMGRPEVFKKDNNIIEIFIFKYKGNLYNKIIRIDFLKKIRGVKKFKNVKDLKLEIKKDISKAENLFK